MSKENTKKVNDSGLYGSLIHQMHSTYDGEMLVIDDRAGWSISEQYPNKLDQNYLKKRGSECRPPVQYH